jgi:hypothetical protein
MTNIYLLISSLFALFSPIVAIYFIFRGQYKPHKMTRLIFFILGSIVFASLFFNGDRQGIYLALFQWLSAIIIFVLSFKYGLGGKSKLDFAVLFLAVVAILTWQITHNSIIALYLSILADFIGLVPTLVKIYKQPDTETPIFYLSDCLSGLFSCLAIASLEPALISFPFYIFFMNLFCFVLLTFNRRFLKNI